MVSLIMQHYYTKHIDRAVKNVQHHLYVRVCLPCPKQSNFLCNTLMLMYMTHQRRSIKDAQHLVACHISYDPPSIQKWVSTFHFLLRELLEIFNNTVTRTRFFLELKTFRLYLEKLIERESAAIQNENYRLRLRMVLFSHILTNNYRGSYEYERV